MQHKVKLLSHFPAEEFPIIINFHMERKRNMKKIEKVKVYIPRKERIKQIQQQIMMINRVITAV